MTRRLFLALSALVYLVLMAGALVRLAEVW
jgi:hypothetical protein